MSESAPETQNFYDGPLYKLLEDRLPHHRTRRGLLDVRSLTDKLGYSYQYGYKWLNTGRLSPEVAKAIVKEAQGRIDLEELLPFVFA